MAVPSSLDRPIMMRAVAQHECRSVPGRNQIRRATDPDLTRCGAAHGKYARRGLSLLQFLFNLSPVHGTLIRILSRLQLSSLEPLWCAECLERHRHAGDRIEPRP